jgi:hypothetical protein
VAQAGIAKCKSPGNEWRGACGTQAGAAGPDQSAGGQYTVSTWETDLGWHR